MIAWQKVLTDEEYEQIAINMSKGIKFFNPTFEGTRIKPYALL